MWLPIRGYKGRYEVSDDGQVRSFVIGKFSPKKRGVPFVMKPMTAGALRYLRVTLTRKNGTHKQAYVHVLVAQAFLGRRPSGDWRKVQVNHKNGNNWDNRAANLQYIAPSQNQLHSSAVMRSRTGASNGMAKLTEFRVKQIRQMRPCDAARKFGIHYQHAYAIKHRLFWKHVR